MKFPQLVLVIILSMGVAFITTQFISPNKASTTTKETTYDRVMRTQTIRCGYAVWPPFLAKDPNTNQMSGIFYDYLENLGRALHLKIEWAEEVGLGDFAVALETGRIDAMCLTVWPNAARSRNVDFTKPIFYTPFYAYARQGDTRFDHAADKIDDPSTTITVIDGEMGALIAASDYPKAHTLQLSQLDSPTELYNNVFTKKADVLFADPASFAKFEAQNPGQLHPVISDHPLRVFGNTLAVALGQDEFRRMLDTSTSELLSSGVIEKIIVKYEQYPGTLLRVAPPYLSEKP